MPETSPATIRTPHHMLTIIAWFFIIGIAAGAYLFQGGYLGAHQFPKSLKPITVSSSGYVLLNLSYGNGSEHTYAVNVSSQSLNRVSNLAFTPSSSLDGRYLVSTAEHTLAGSIIGDVLRFDTNLSTTSLFATGVTGLPRFPQLSPDNKWVVFNTLPVTGAARGLSGTPSSWGIALAAEGAAPHIIAYGLFPHWSPDGSSIVYVSNEGLRSYTIASSTDTVVFKLTGGGANSQMALSISRDGSRLVWTDPLHQQLMLAHISSWNPFTARVDRILNTSAYFPVFSPDGSHVVFEQERLGASTASSTNASLVLLDTTTFATTNLIHLTSMNQSSLFITGWVNNL